MSRELIVVDLETTGLEDHHVPLEIAFLAPDAPPRYFVPYLPPGDLVAADPDALSINRYFERKVYKDQLSPPDTEQRYIQLHEYLTGNTLAGSNPRFDAGMLSRQFNYYGLSREPWHHRLADISNYAAIQLGFDPTKLPGLSDICKALGVVNKEPHSAMGDVIATAECFRILLER